MEKSKILPLYIPTTGCDYHRIMLPFQERGYELRKYSLEELEKVKMLVFNRYIHQKEEVVTALKKDFGITFVQDMDDYWELYPTHYLFQTWKQNKTKEKMLWHMAQAVLTICSTERLAKKVEQLGFNTAVIPNSIPFSGQFLPNRGEYTGPVRFGFVGGTSHLGDIHSIAYAIQAFPQLNFTLAGFTEKSSQCLGMARILGHHGKNPNFRTIGVKSLDTYMESYDTIDCCIAPLMDVEFNKYKSNLKVLEAGAKKCAIICSANECYTDTVPDDIVTYCKSIKDWKQAIKKHSDRAYTKERGEKLHDWVKTNYNMAEVNPKRFKLLTDLLPYERVDQASVSPDTMPVV